MKTARSPRAGVNGRGHGTERMDLPMHLNATTTARFWATLDRSGGPEACWPWTGHIDKDGYGIFYYRDGGRRYRRRAHRIAWPLRNGPVPDGKRILHSCPDGDRRECGNPSHLRPGTDLDNAQDAKQRGRTARGDRNASRLHPERVARGERHRSRTRPETIARGDDHWTHRSPERQARGERRGSARLTEDAVRVMRSRYTAGGVTLRQLAAEYQISPGTVSKIVRREKWRHVA